MSLYYAVDFTKTALLTGYFLMGCGFAATFWVPSSRIWGKRHTFIIGALIVTVTSAWSGGCRKKDDYQCMLWSRIFQGIGAAPFEALVNAAVGDLYFVHQRGKRMAFTNLAVFGGAFFTPIVVGKITYTIHWWWSFFLVAIFTAVCLPLIVFFCPETAYRRAENLNLDMLATNEHDTAAQTVAPDAVVNNSTAPEAPDPNAQKPEPAVEKSSSDAENEAGTPVTKPASWQSRLALFNGRKTDDSFFKLLLRPFPLLFFQPAFLWASLIQGTMIGWTVFIGVLLGKFFFGPPLWWTEIDTGYAYTGAFIGAIGGFIVAGGLADWSAKLMTKWNGGIYEPEFRLLLVIPQLIIGCMGLYGFGFAADGVMTRKMGWPVPLMFFGFEVAGMVIGAVASSLYIVDAYRKLRTLNIHSPRLTLLQGISPLRASLA